MGTACFFACGALLKIKFSVRFLVHRVLGVLETQCTLRENFRTTMDLR